LLLADRERSLDGLKSRSKWLKVSLENSLKKPRSCEPKALEQISIDLRLQKSSLNDAEKEVVEVLADRYNRTGSKFIKKRIGGLIAIGE